jgi:hypothetical protein
MNLALSYRRLFLPLLPGLGRGGSLRSPTD